MTADESRWLRDALAAAIEEDRRQAVPPDDFDLEALARVMAAESEEMRRLLVDLAG